MPITPENIKAWKDYINNLKWSKKTLQRIVTFGIVFLLIVIPLMWRNRKEIKEGVENTVEVIDAIKTLPDMQIELKQNEADDKGMQKFIIEYVNDEKERDLKQDKINHKISKQLLDIQFKTFTKKELKEILEANQETVYHPIRDTGEIPF